MKLYICPECKDVIEPGKLCGNHQNCTACAKRIDTTDLIEMDTAEALSNSRNPSSAPSSNQPYANNVNGFLGQLKSLSDQMQQYQAMQEDALRYKPEEIPNVSSLSQVMLIPKAHLEHLDAGSVCINPLGTIVIEPLGDKMILIFAIVWLSFCLVFFGIVFYAMISDPSSITVGGRHGHGRPAKPGEMLVIIPFSLIFFGVGFGMLYWGIMSNVAKTWIAVDSENLYCMHGLKFNPDKYKTVRRNLKNTDVDCRCTAQVNHTPVYTITLNSNGESVKLASGLRHDDAAQYTRMIQTLLNSNFTK